MSSSVRLGGALVGSLFLALGASVAGLAAGGDLDTSFGEDGKVTTAFGTGAGARAVAIQPDGKTVAAGYTWGGRFALARYNSDGTLDTSFGGDGSVTTEFPGRDAGASGLAIQVDGKIVVAGTTTRSGDNAEQRFALARYNSDGTLDTTFSGDGKVSTDLRPRGDYVHAVAIQQDGRIIAIGETGGRRKFGLARYNSDGTLDLTFGDGGKVVTDFGQGDEVGESVALQADGRIVAVGGGSGDFLVARYNPEGTLDTSFGVDGKVISDLGFVYQSAEDVAIQADGKIVAAGWGECFGGSCTIDFVLARYNANGTLDTTFGDGGSAQGGFGYAFPNAVAIQDDGKIVAAGSSNDQEGYDFALARFDIDGTLDIEFGTGGTLVTSFGRFSAGREVAIQIDQRIVVAGVARLHHVFAVARYLSS